jgi:hypothetical protein
VVEGGNMLKLVVILLSLTCLGAQKDASPDVIEYGEPTRFEVSMEKNTYYVGEPVELTATLHNDRDRPIRGDFIDIKYNWIYYRKVGGEFVRYFPRWLQLMSTADVISAGTEIPAHGKIEGTAKLFFNSYNKELVLSEPGEYEFKVTYGGNKPILESNIARVKVVEPPEEEREAVTMLHNPDLASLIEGDLRSGWVEDKDIEAGAEKAVAFLQAHGRSMYAPLVKDQLKFVLNEAAGKGKLTPKLKELQASLPDLQ